MPLPQSRNVGTLTILVLCTGLFLAAPLCHAESERSNPFTGKKNGKESTGTKESSGKPSEPLPPLPSPGSASGIPGDKKDSPATIWHIVGISSNLVSLVDKNDRLLVLKNGDDIGDCVVAYPQIECRSSELAKARTAPATQRGTTKGGSERSRKGNRKSVQKKPSQNAETTGVTAVVQPAPAAESAPLKTPEIVVQKPASRTLSPPTWFGTGTLVEHKGTGEVDLVVEKGTIKAMRVTKGKTAQIERTMGPYITARSEDDYYTYLKVDGLNIKETPQ